MKAFFPISVLYSFQNVKAYSYFPACPVLQFSHLWQSWGVPCHQAHPLLPSSSAKQTSNIKTCYLWDTQSGRGGGWEEKSGAWCVCVSCEHTSCVCQNFLSWESLIKSVQNFDGEKKTTQRVYALFILFYFCLGLKFSSLLDRTRCHILALSESSWTSKHRSLNEATCWLAFQFWILQTTSSFQSFLSKTTGKIVYSRGCASG